MSSFLSCFVGPCHHGIACPQAVDGGDSLQMSVAMNILRKQIQTANNRWPPSLGIGQGANNSSQQKTTLFQNVTQGIRIG